MRGKRCRRCGARGVCRIIPAHAGQTSSAHGSAAKRTDHPRTCGANIYATPYCGAKTGSSPHMRGKQLRYCQIRAHGRIIPAHAGQTDPPYRRVERGSDHPRTCGANMSSVSAWSRTIGSSPHMRGKPGNKGAGCVGRRIIPAHAGQTQTIRTGYAHHADHPRTCGANGGLAALAAKGGGSSPHMRGKQQGARHLLRVARIIPAHAGQTRSRSGPAPDPKDHPRTCGANALAYRIREGRDGSSPHMRGKRRPALRHYPRVRIIPAHAGQTYRPDCSRRSCPDHPRTCGANAMREGLFHKLAGSSPHMRGKHADIEAEGRQIRIIPAHAGQTEYWVNWPT